MVAATLLFEGGAHETREQQRAVYEIAAKYGGMKAGSVCIFLVVDHTNVASCVSSCCVLCRCLQTIFLILIARITHYLSTSLSLSLSLSLCASYPCLHQQENGVRGYFLTYMIAYLRDFGYNFKFMAESFETSVPYEHVYTICESVKKTISEKAASVGVKGTPFISCRVTQLYDTGAAVYFYFGFMWDGLEDPIAAFTTVETAARDEIIRLGGCISHHHGVGKHRRKWVVPTVSETGLSMIKAVKTELDPKNIFACGNFFPDA